MSRLSFYIFRSSFIGFIISLMAVFVSIILVDLVEQIRAISGVKDANTFTALGLTMLRLPSLTEQTIPIAILIGTLFTFTGLSRRSEITALRAAGVSAWRFISPLAIMVFAIGIFMITIVRPFAAKLDETYENTKAHLIGTFVEQTSNAQTITWTTFPVTSGQIIISGNRVNESTFTHATALLFDAKGTDFIKRLDAERIEKTPQKLILNNVIIGETGKDTQIKESLEIGLGNSAQETQLQDAKILSLWQLPSAAKDAANTGGSPERYWLQFYKLLALPITMLAMAIFAATMSLGLDRSGGKARSIMIAIALGVAMYFLTDITGMLATSGWIPSPVAALSPSILSLTLVIAYLSYKEDGI